MSLAPRRLMADSLVAAALDPVLADKPALIADGQHWSYRQLYVRAVALAGSLKAHGVKRGDRVAIYLDNGETVVTAIYAAWLADAVVVVINPQTKADKLAFMLKDCTARALISDGHLARHFVPAIADGTAVEFTVCSGQCPDGSKIIVWDQAVAFAGEVAAPQNIALDLAALIYTSGSTGQAKAVMQTHQAMRFSLGSIIEYLRLAADDRILCALPVAFDYGLYQLLMSVDLGATLVLERSFTFPAQVFATMHEHAVTVVPGVPTLFAMILAAHRRQPLAFPSVRTVTNTAAALPDAVAAQLAEVFPQAAVFSMYGLTECKRVSFLEPEWLARKPGSVGKAMPGTEVFILDDDKHAVTLGEIGILHVRGPHVMLGYWNRPDATAAALTDGLLPGEKILCTGDHFRMDDDGFLYFVGRGDDIIKSRGEKVSPAEIENVLHQLAGVREAAVIGVPDSMLGQAVCAFIVADPGVELSARQVRAHCSAQLENFMLPSHVHIVDELPRTNTGKVNKSTLRSEFAEANDAQ